MHTLVLVVTACTCKCPCSIASAHTDCNSAKYPIQSSNNLIIQSINQSTNNSDWILSGPSSEAHKSMSSLCVIIQGTESFNLHTDLRIILIIFFIVFWNIVKLHILLKSGQVCVVTRDVCLRIISRLVASTSPENIFICCMGGNCYRPVNTKYLYNIYTMLYKCYANVLCLLGEWMEHIKYPSAI